MVVQLVGWVAAVCSRVPVQVAAAEVVPKVLEVVAEMAVEVAGSAEKELLI